MNHAADRATSCAVHPVWRDDVESIVKHSTDGRPCIDQRVVPVEQDGARWLQALRPGHVPPRPALRKRKTPRGRRRAVRPTLPSPHPPGPSIFDDRLSQTRWHWWGG